MATNLALDDQLIEDAKKVGGHATKKEAVTEALKQYVQAHQQKEILDLFGKIEFEKAYNYKKQRARK